MQKTQVQSVGQEEALGKEWAAHSSILAWRLPWTVEPGGLSPWGHRVTYNLATKQQQTHTQGMGGCVRRMVDSISLERAHGKGAGPLIITAITY